jgi:hypothetical protein
MGLLAYTLPTGVTVWGHTGETPGYATGVFATRDLARTLVYAITPVGPAPGSQVLAAERSASPRPPMTHRLPPDDTKCWIGARLLPPTGPDLRDEGGGIIDMNGLFPTMASVRR